MNADTDKDDCHHLILGELRDYLSGESIADTHDERYRQKIAHLLVDRLGFNKNDIEKSKQTSVHVDEKQADFKLDFLVSIEKKVCMLIRYAPGSLVSRRQCTLGWSRIVMPYQIPLAVITNGEDAEVLEGKTGNVIGNGLESIPSKEQLIKIYNEFDFSLIPDRQRIMASRIVYAFEVDGSCLMP